MTKTCDTCIECRADNELAELQEENAKLKATIAKHNEFFNFLRRADNRVKDE